MRTEASMLNPAAGMISKTRSGFPRLCEAHPPEPCPTRLRRVPRHVEGVEFIEQPVGAEVSEDATLKDALELDPVFGLEEGRLVKPSLTGVAVAGLREDAVGDQHVEVKVRI